VSAAQQSAAITQRLSRLVGAEPFVRPGVVHIASAWQDASTLRAIAIGPAAPRSPSDAFLLDAVRARADFVLTTGRILRLEPRLQHWPPPGETQSFERWRSDVVGKPEAPRSVVLTSGRELPAEHPVLDRARRAARPLLLTTSEGERSLRAWAREQDIDVVSPKEPGPRAAIEHLIASGDELTIAIEAGPTTTASLYDEPCLVDELILGRYLEPSLPEAARGGPLPERARLERALPVLIGSSECEEPSGRWRFERRRRRG
jgi:riboflavin biosynthesis pyrimidine reductase